jgi:hypothetical protein
MGKSPTLWNGTLYPTRKDAARAIGIDEKAMTARKRYGYSSDAEMKYKQPIVFRGKEYASIKEAAQLTHYSYDTVKKYVAKSTRASAETSLAEETAGQAA